MINYSDRHIHLNNSFMLGKNTSIEGTNLSIKFCNFTSQYGDECVNIKLPESGSVSENFQFQYPVFIPKNSAKYTKAILLLHGLNERSWSKYLGWAEYLCRTTEIPVILFPIAYHINRAPDSWSNPRNMTSLVTQRKDKYSGERSISYANVALSERISAEPTRFYRSGRQTLHDLTQLFTCIKEGLHPFFKEDTSINIFAYSIGAFLSQVALMANPKNLFSQSRLFMFCGGSIFSSMFGISRSIMDRPAFEKLQQYYINVFGNESPSSWKRDGAFAAFRRMIVPEKFRDERESIFSSLHNKIKGITLAKDVVIPYSGVVQALGKENASSAIKLLDFPFQYTHENPFPYNEKDAETLNHSFEKVFSEAASFLI